MLFTLIPCSHYGTVPSERLNQMRLISRLLVFLLLIGIAAFTPLAPVTNADTCSDDCLKSLQRCVENCHSDSACLNGCVKTDKDCLKACPRDLAAEESET